MTDKIEIIEDETDTSRRAITLRLGLIAVSTFVAPMAMLANVLKRNLRSASTRILRAQKARIGQKVPKARRVRRVQVIQRHPNQKSIRFHQIEH